MEEPQRPLHRTNSSSEEYRAKEHQLKEIQDDPYILEQALVEENIGPAKENNKRKDSRHQESHKELGCDLEVQWTASPSSGLHIHLPFEVKSKLDWKSSREKNEGPLADVLHRGCSRAIFPRDL